MPKGYKHTDEAKAKIGKATKIRGRSEEHNRKLALSHTGLKHSEESKEKMRISQTGKKQSPKTVEKRTKAIQGENCYNAMLTEEDVLEIRKLRKTTRMTLKEIGKQFNVSMYTIHDIVKRRSWKHI